MANNRDGNDIQAAVYAACDEMLREEISVKRITGRKVAGRDGVAWSHTTVTPFVSMWHEQRAEKERSAIKQTQMSSNFVKALHREVEDRVVALRKIDSEQFEMLQTELQDMIETNAKIEHELADTKAKLANKTEQSTQASALAEQCKKDKLKAESVHKEAIETLQSRYSDDVKDLKQTIESNQTKYITERIELKEENKDAIRKLTEKNDELHSDLKNKTAECAEAKVKAENFKKIAAELEIEKNKTAKLNENIIRQAAELETKQNALISAEQTATDCKIQRDKAQSSRDAT